MENQTHELFGSRLKNLERGKRSNGENNLGIKCENELITNESDLTDLFNDYFVNIASNLKEPIVDSDWTS